MSFRRRTLVRLFGRRVGSDWVEIRVMDTADKSLADTDRVGSFGARWPRFQGILLQRLRRAEKSAYSSKNEFQKSLLPRTGTPQSADKLSTRTGAPAALPAVPSDDGKCGSSSGSEGTSGTRSFIRKSRNRNSHAAPGLDADCPSIRTTRCSSSPTRAPRTTRASS